MIIAAFVHAAPINPIVNPSRRGYTAMLCGEAGSAPGAEEGRELSHQRAAENGLPPGTAASARMRRRVEPRTCLCGTHGPL